MKWAGICGGGKTGVSDLSGIEGGAGGGKSSQQCRSVLGDHACLVGSAGGSGDRGGERGGVSKFLVFAA